MNGNEARKVVEVNSDYKYVADIAKSLLVLAKMDLGKTHASMGFGLGLIEGAGTKQNPFRPKDGDNFRAGRMKMDVEGRVISSGISTDFPKYSFNDAELQAFFEVADIRF